MLFFSLILVLEMELVVIFEKYENIFKSVLWFRQDWIPRFSVLGHHGLKRMIELRLPGDLYLER